jgi:hypothetical protein
MLRRRTERTQIRPVDADVLESDFPKQDEELSPRELMARLTREVEQKIEASFAKKLQHNSN